MYSIKKGQLGEEEEKVVVFFSFLKTVVVFLVGLDREIPASKHLLESQYQHCLHSYVKLRMQRIAWKSDLLNHLRNS